MRRLFGGRKWNKAVRLYGVVGKVMVFTMLLDCLLKVLKVCSCSEAVIYRRKPVSKTVLPNEVPLAAL